VITTYKDDAARDWVDASVANAIPSSDSEVSKTVDQIIQRVRRDGDKALLELAQQFGDELLVMPLPSETINTAIDSVDPETKQILTRSAERIEKLGEELTKQMKPVKVQYDEFEVGINFQPVERVGCYVPSGLYPLPSTALMTTVTAEVAGVKEIAVFSPKFTNEIIFAASLSGATEFYQVGGAQAVAAAAFGTDSIKRTDMFVGPGNRFVAEAKRQLQGVVGIDMLAGPSEVVIIADKDANPAWVALDLLSQAEHGPDSRAILITTDDALASEVAAEIETLIKQGLAPDYIQKSLAISAILVLPSMAECGDAANQLAPEHLELQIRNPNELRSQCTNFGAMFVGYEATVPFGDYMSGANHTLPTMRAARFSGTLTPIAFLRPQSWLCVPQKAIGLSTDTANFAKLEGLNLHAAAAAARLDKI
jgi:histidinol dehydrogenase/sulfopropanediol 3-dehydrogenase